MASRDRLEVGHALTGPSFRPPPRDHTLSRLRAGLFQKIAWAASFSFGGTGVLWSLRPRKNRIIRAYSGIFVSGLRGRAEFLLWKPDLARRHSSKCKAPSVPTSSRSARMHRAAGGMRV